MFRRSRNDSWLPLAAGRQAQNECAGRKHSSLSVVCAVHENGPLVAAMLRQFRGVADEIVVAADSRMDLSELSELAGVADRLLRYEYAGPGRAVAWLHRQCSCDWILLMGSDEVPSPALVRQLPELIAADDVLQYWIPTRWSFPDYDHWLDERPWYPDYHNRLVRNDASLSFIGLMHTEATPAFPARYLEAPLYHLNCVLMSADARRRKVELYDRSRPGLTAAGGGSHNAVYYLPEDHRHRPPQRVPPEDRAAIAAVLAAPESSARSPRESELQLAGSAEIDSYWPGRALGPGAYHASLELLERDCRMYAGEHRPFSLRVTHRGDESWPWEAEGPQPIRTTYRLKRPNGAVVVDDGFRTPFRAAIPPGSSSVVPTIVAAPEIPGTYIVEFDLVHEMVRWFRCSTSATILVEAEQDRSHSGRSAGRASSTLPQP